MRGSFNQNWQKNKENSEKHSIAEKSQRSSTEEVQDEESHEESARLSISLVLLSQVLYG